MRCGCRLVTEALASTVGWDAAAETDGHVGMETVCHLGDTAALVAVGIADTGETVCHLDSVAAVGTIDHAETVRHLGSGSAVVGTAHAAGGVGHLGSVAVGTMETAETGGHRESADPSGTSVVVVVVDKTVDAVGLSSDAATHLNHDSFDNE